MNNPSKLSECCDTCRDDERDIPLLPCEACKCHVSDISEGEVHTHTDIYHKPDCKIIMGKCICRPDEAIRKCKGCTYFIGTPPIQEEVNKDIDKSQSFIGMVFTLMGLILLIKGDLTNALLAFIVGELVDMDIRIGERLQAIKEIK